MARDHDTLKLFEHASEGHRAVASRVGQSRQSQLGQFMTPPSVARFMASLFPENGLQAWIDANDSRDVLHVPRHKANVGAMIGLPIGGMQFPEPCQGNAAA